MLKRFFETELNRLNTFVKTATDALMLYIKSRENVLKRFTEQVNFCWLYFALPFCFMLNEGDNQSICKGVGDGGLRCRISLGWVAIFSLIFFFR